VQPKYFFKQEVPYKKRQHWRV